MKQELREALSKIKERISHQTGLKFNFHIEDKLLQAIKQRMDLLSLSDDKLPGYLQKIALGGNNEEVLKLAELLVNLETYFFRDKGQVKLLQHQILPKIIKKRYASKTVKIWCAGCSTGEEAYSLAMLIVLLIPSWSEWKINIIGTDIHEEALEKARQGIYSSSSFRSINPNIFQTFFLQTAPSFWKIEPRVLNLVTFYHHNLVADPLPSMVDQLYEMDLILCRNVFIYFQSHAILTVIKKIVTTLCNGGILITGHGELQNIHVPTLEKLFLRESAIFQKRASGPFEGPDLNESKG